MRLRRSSLLNSPGGARRRKTGKEGGSGEGITGSIYWTVTCRQDERKCRKAGKKAPVFIDGSSFRGKRGKNFYQLTGSTG